MILTPTSEVPSLVPKTREWHSHAGQQDALNTMDNQLSIKKLYIKLSVVKNIKQCKFSCIFVRMPNTKRANIKKTFESSTAFIKATEIKRDESDSQNLTTVLYHKKPLQRA